MDDGIGKVVQSLKETGKFDNTIIFFLSDNGGQLEDGANNGNLRDGKQSMYEGGIKVPCFVASPSRIKAGTNSQQRLHVIDIFPTLAEIAGVKFDHKIDGISFLPILKNSEATLDPRPLFFFRREGGFKYGGETIEAVISGNMKLLHNSPYEPLELYDLFDDPLETRNLIKSNHKKYKALHQLLIEQIRRGGSVPWQKSEEKK